MPIANELRVRLFAVAVLVAAAASHPLTQTPTAADGPWSGQMQCVLTVRGPNYQDDQTHTWRITPGPPFLNGVFRQWPAVWSVQGSGSRVLTTGASETWKTTVPETNAPLAFSVNAVTGQMRIGSQHGLLNINGGITGSTSNAGGTLTPIISALQEWPFPIVDDVATATTISGTRTRTAVNTSGWRQPPGVPTTETCTWRFDKTTATNAPVSQSSGATGTTSSGTTLRSAGPVGAIQTTAPTPTSDTTRNKEAFADGDARAAVVASLAIKVTYPNGGETLNVGTPVTIQWSHLLTINTMFTADVSYDGGATWTPTNSSTNTTSGTGSLSWTVSGNATTRARIRLRTTDGAYADLSDADFTIASTSGTGNTSSTGTSSTTCTGTCTVRVTSPNGGETWTWGVSSTGYRLTWTSTYPSTQSFDVNFSADGGASWTHVTRTTGLGVTFGSSLSGAGVQWVPPITESALFNVTPYRQPGGDTSDASFHIRKPVMVTSPNGGETLTIGIQATITYTWAYTSQSGYIPALQVSYDGGATWVDERDAQVSTVTNNAGQATAQWRVLGPAATRARVRINAVVDPRLGSGGVVSSDESDADFTIVESSTPSTTGTVRVTSPNGGETWTWGAASAGYRLTWTSTYPSTQSFDVNFSADGGASWTHVTRTTGLGVTFGSSLSGAGVQWVPPITESALFNVTPYGQPGGDTSDASFHIHKPVVVTSPNGGETLTIGIQATITYTWAYTSQSGYIPALQVSYDGGATWVDERDAQVSTVTNNAGQATAQWRVLGPAATRARVRINAVVDPRLGSGGVVSSDESDADFTIVESSTPSTTGTVRVTSPNGGETWTWGAASAGYRLTWTSTYPSTQSFDVNFSADGGASWTHVTRTTGLGVTFGSSLSGAGVQWVPPITESALFNVTPYGQPGGDTSDASFHIRKPVVVTSPNGGETLTIGIQATITYTWAYTSQSGYIPALQVSYDGGATWVDERDAQVSTVTNNAGQATAQWRVLGPAATRARVRINAVVDPRLGSTSGVASSDESDADFTIVSAP